MVWISPYFRLASATWTACVVRWDPETGLFTRVEGPTGFDSYDDAVAAATALAA